MKKIIIIFILAIIYHHNINGQKILDNETIFYQKALNENIFIHYNSSFFLSGENLYYSVFCIKTRGHKLSNLSKVAYVELLNSQKEIIFKHKIRLNKSIGNGSFFIPATLATGNYKLIAYTQWMRNESDNYFFQGDITIINPFQSNQQLAQKLSDTITQKITHKIITIKKGIKDINSTTQNTIAQLILKKENFKKREKVDLKIITANEKQSYGIYSISIRKIDSLTTFDKYTSKTYPTIYPQKKDPKNFIKEKAKFLPEFKGELLRGKIINRKTLEPLSNIKVILSIPNKKHIIKFATTNDSGIFNFNLKIKPENPKAIIQILDDNRENYKLSIFEQKPLIYKNLTFKSLVLSPKTKELVLNHSIQNQIENAYLDFKRDTLSIANDITNNSYSKKIYMLDDYTRFPTVKETIVEIINNVWITKKRKKYTFHVKNNDPYDKDKFLPLVFIDGFLTQDHNELVNYNTNKIKSISVIRDKFTFQSYSFLGIIEMKTFDGDYKNGLSNSYIKNLNLHIPLKINSFYDQKYINNEFNRIPDYRRQLLWIPKYDLDKKENNIIFYTSDINGNYEICLEGFNHNGEPVSLKRYFSVK